MVFKALKKVFRKPLYVFISLVVTVAVFLFAVYFSNIALIIKVFSISDLAFSKKIILLVTLIGSIFTNFSFFSAFSTIVIAILFGISIAMMVYFLRNQIKKEINGITSGFLGIISGVVGIGCAACGSVLLTSILSLFGATYIITLLPFNGGEFGIVGILLLSVSVYTLSKKIINPNVC